MLKMEEDLIATQLDYRDLESKNNFSFVITQTLNPDNDPDYERFLADVWVGIVLTLMVLSCVCCMCSCLLYHKFQQWKRNVIEARSNANLEAGNAESELPSYTIASGLPSYQEALEQLKKVKELMNNDQKNNQENWTPRTLSTPSLNALSVANLFQIYNNRNVEQGVVNAKYSSCIRD